MALPNGLMVKVDRVGYVQTWELTPEDIKKMWSYDSIKPYLRPMSSMTEEEEKKLISMLPFDYGQTYFEKEKGRIEIFEANKNIFLYVDEFSDIVNFLLANHFDFMGLRPLGVAIDCTGLNIY